MATELQLLLRFETYPPRPEDIEFSLDCDVLEYVEEEV